MDNPPVNLPPSGNMPPTSGGNPVQPISQPGLTDSVVTSQTNTVSNSGNVIIGLLGNKKRLLIIVLIAFLTLFVFATGTFAMIGYGKLPIGSPKFRMAAADALMSLPFTPKTPEYVLRQSIRKSASIKKFGFDSSIAIDNVGSMLGLGSSGVDLSIKGALDMADSKNPLGHLRILLTKELDLDLRVKDKKAYVKLNKFPQTVISMLSMLGLPQSIMDEVINKWFYFDSTPLDTEARKVQNDKKDDTDKKLKQVNDAVIEALGDGRIKLKNSMVSERLNNVSVYKITTVINPNAIYNTQKVISDTLDEKKKPISKDKEDKMQKAISDSISDIEVVSHIDKSTYYLKKIIISFKLKQQTEDSSLGSSMDMFSGPLALGSMDKEIPVSIVMNYSAINEPVNVEVPKDSISFDELQRRIAEKIEAARPSEFMGGSFQRASNAKRRSDVNAILRAVSMYEAEGKGNLPANIDTTAKMIAKTSVDLCALLSPEYIAVLPADPNINMGREIEDCGANYMTGYMISRSANGKITVSALYAENGEIISETR